MKRSFSIIVNYFLYCFSGHPIETPEVQAAKHAHFKAHAEAASAAHYAPHQYYAPHYSGAGFGGGHYQHAVALSAHGTPVETPEVQAAKHAHLQVCILLLSFFAKNMLII